MLISNIIQPFFYFGKSKYVALIEKLLTISGPQSPIKSQLFTIHCSSNRTTSIIEESTVYTIQYTYVLRVQIDRQSRFFNTRESSPLIAGVLKHGGIAVQWRRRLDRCSQESTIVISSGYYRMITERCCHSTCFTSRSLT